MSLGCCCAETPDDGKEVKKVKKVFGEWVPDEIPEVIMAESRDVFLPTNCFTRCCGGTLDLPKSKTYEVQLDRSKGEDIGLTLDTSESDYCLIAHVEEGGLAWAWNQGKPSTETLSAGDRIRMVDNTKGSSGDLSKKLEAEKELRLSVQHPRISNATLERNDKPLGLVLDTTAGVGVLIAEIQDGGVISEWNATQDIKIRPQARIVEVNGERRHESLIEELTVSQTPRMKIIDWAQQP